LMRAVARSGVTGKARLDLLHGVVPSATFKRRTRLKRHESEKPSAWPASSRWPNCSGTGPDRNRPAVLHPRTVLP
jgi:hypothetical protein